MTLAPTRPDPEHKLSAGFGFDQVLANPAPLSERLSACLSSAIDFLDSHTASSAVSDLAQIMHLTRAQREILLSAVASVGHIGFMLPAGTDEVTLGAIAAKAGLAISDIAPSEIFARELGSLVGKPAVPTRIFRLEGVGINIEAFVPDAASTQVNAWIENGVGTHLAFRLGSRDSVEDIQNMLAACGYFVPPFMNGRPMENRNKGSLILYCDLPVREAGKRFRVEFYHES